MKHPYRFQCLLTLFTLFIFSLVTVSVLAAERKMAAPSSKVQPPKRASQITKRAGPGMMSTIQLLPSNRVAKGTNVTVKVLGVGSCIVIIETNGASDYDGGFGDYQIPMGKFPRTVSFKANKVGTFQIGAIGVQANKKSCVPGGKFAINTKLTVYGRYSRKRIIRKRQ